jgi:SMODS and SLOG-associating 2TM effector domain 1/SMODS and SLOG-associating 2TM effector domain 3
MRKIVENDFTSLHIASDTASNRAQSAYVRIIATDLIAMLAASAIATYNYETASAKSTLYVISGLLLLLSLILTIVLLTMKFEDIWYQGRALAESCKTLTWRFITRSELFEDSVPLAQAKQKFIERINDLSKEFSELNKVLDARLVNLPIITPLMLDIRNLDLLERKKYYIQNRIEDQKKWYSDKAEFNKGKYNFWFAIIILAQSVSLISVVYMIVHPNASWNLVGLFTTISAAAISWLQLKRHQELKQAYTTASQELNIIVSLSEDISNENDFSKFVLDSENAVSREHTLWLAQRRK